MRTWHFELAVVAVILFGIALLSGGWLELVGAAAVTLSFAHVQVADRLAEGEAQRDQFAKEGVRNYTSSDIAARWAHNQTEYTAHCHAWAGRYLVAKELLWLVYFVALGAWSAIAGVALFLLYPFWRKWWRRN